MDSKYIAFIAVIALVAVVAFSQLGSLNLSPGSVVSVSNINFDGSSAKVVTSWVANANDEGVLYQAPTNITLANQSILTLNNGLGIVTSPRTPYCFAPTYYQSKTVGGIFGFGTRNLEYYSLGAFEKHVPFYLKVTQQQPFAAVTVASQVVDTQPSLSFSAPNGGVVTIRNLGQLSGIYSCPTGDAVIIKNSSGKWEVVSQAAFLDAVQRAQNSFNGWNLVDWYNFYTTNYLDSLTTPSSWDYRDTVTSATPNGVNVSLPLTAGSAFLTAEGDLKFFGGAVYTPAKGDPAISSLSAANTITQGTMKNGVVIVKNFGAADTFQYTFTSLGSRVSFGTPTVGLNFGAGEEKSYTFSYYGANTGGLNSVGDQLCVQVQAIGSGKFVNRCSALTVEAPVVNGEPTIIPVPTGTITPTFVPVVPTPITGQQFVCSDGTIVTNQNLCNKTDWFMIAFLGGLVVVGGLVVTGKIKVGKK